MRFSPQRAIVVSFIVAWLFLPVLVFPIPGIPDITKMSATCYSVLLATIVFDAARIGLFKPSWLDLPMLIWCICPFAASITNDLSPYDGFTSVLDQTMTWGVPYFLGRIYLGNLSGLRQLAIGIFTGGLVYIPLCLLEIRISPQLHRIVYGYNAREDFSQTIRNGGYRPTVFMEHGLMVGAWIMAATLIGIWLWKAGVIKQLWSIPIRWLVIALLVTSILVKSFGASMLLVIGIVILFVALWFRTALPLLLLSISISLYLCFAINGTFISDQIVSFMSGIVPQERVASLEFRYNNEDILSDKAREKIVFGWGGWGRSRIYDEWGKDISVTDSLWIIAFGTNGAVGLISLTASLLLPAIAFLQVYPARLWHKRELAPAAVLAVLLALYMVDCVLNAMTNPVYTLACGGLVGVVLQQTRASKVSKRSFTTQRSLHQQRPHHNSFSALNRSDKVGK
ncbi:O-antigen ligase domain-containing protein [Nostoc sp. CHAB 5836]|uniref:O-antigen ligase domain-containing protein n=1 Tax=Nostoc sp. CHAB 5836 TaxID=2780404 RepID=UPI001E4DB1DF|nr:O-antigen ligase domain-containing protein [Nostoc sp. CHAB 5836]MCC5619085.1 O-antigen ligase domain-containing protein [Nostoc sp. CHAB 5836]